MRPSLYLAALPALHSRYLEAEAASRRMQELHTSQAAGLRQDLLASQQKELQAVLELHQREEQRLAQAWQERVSVARSLRHARCWMAGIMRAAVLQH